MDQLSDTPIDDLWEAKALHPQERAAVGEGGIPENRRGLAVRVAITPK